MTPVRSGTCAPVARSRLRSGWAKVRGQRRSTQAWRERPARARSALLSPRRLRSALGPWPSAEAPSCRQRRCHPSAPPTPPAYRSPVARRHRCRRVSAIPWRTPSIQASSPVGPVPQGWPHARHRRRPANANEDGERGWRLGFHGRQGSTGVRVSDRGVSMTLSALMGRGLLTGAPTDSLYGGVSAKRTSAFGQEANVRCWRKADSESVRLLPSHGADFDSLEPTPVCLLSGERSLKQTLLDLPGDSSIPRRRSPT